MNTVLGAFDPEKEFVVEVGEPIKQSWLPTAELSLCRIIAMLALVRPPTPLEKTAIELRKLADKIDASANSAEDKQLAQKVKRSP